MWLSEGVDLHRACRHLIHYELDPSPVRTIQRNGRVRRVGSWAALTQQPIRTAYPAFIGVRDEKTVTIMRQRIRTFCLLLGGAPQVNNAEPENEDQRLVDQVLSRAHRALSRQNHALALCDAAR